jgi:hypothetical protein
MLAGCCVGQTGVEKGDGSSRCLDRTSGEELDGAVIWSFVLYANCVESRGKKNEKGHCLSCGLLHRSHRAAGSISLPCAVFCDVFADFFDIFLRLNGRDAFLCTVSAHKLYR